MPIKLRHNCHLDYQLTDADLEIVRRREYDLCCGEASIDDTLFSHQVCVMQLTSMLLSKRRITETDVEVVDDEVYGGTVTRWRGTNEQVEAYTDHPICVSETITDFLIELNDSCPHDERQRLADVVPEIVGTCPVVVHEEQSDYNPDQLVVVEDRDETPEYQDLERTRITILGDVNDARTLDEKLSAVRAAAALR